jgi:hypothetical protein
MSCKIDSVIREHELGVPQTEYEGINEYLLRRWTGEDERQPEGYRSLTEWFNKRLLKQVYDEYNREVTGIRLESEYKTLRSGDELTKRELEDDLSADGINVADLESSMVSWSTMRHHLNGCLDGSKPIEEARTDWELESVRIASEQMEETVTEAVSSLISKGEITDGEGADITIGVQLTCPECHIRTPFSQAVERGYICQKHAADISDERSK